LFFSASLLYSRRHLVTCAAATTNQKTIGRTIEQHFNVRNFSNACSTSTSKKSKLDYLDSKYKKYVKLNPENKIIVLGFGAIGTGILPLLFRHIDMKNSQVIIMANQFDEKQKKHAADYGATIVEAKLTKNQYKDICNQYIKKGDFLVNVSVDVSSVALIEHCSSVGALYIDSCNEPWAGGYSDPNASASQRSNYAFREQALTLKSKLKSNGATAVITHGANPGIVSQFVKQALLNIARDTNEKIEQIPTTSEQWAKLAQKLGIKVNNKQTNKYEFQFFFYFYLFPR
jgi:homospermidine synthase